MTAREPLYQRVVSTYLAWSGTPTGDPSEPTKYSAYCAARRALREHDAVADGAPPADGYEAVSPNLAPNPANTQLHARNE